MLSEDFNRLLEGNSLIQRHFLAYYLTNEQHILLEKGLKLTHKHKKTGNPFHLKGLDSETLRDFILTGSTKVKLAEGGNSSSEMNMLGKEGTLSIQHMYSNEKMVGEGFALHEAHFRIATAFCCDSMSLGVAWSTGKFHEKFGFQGEIHNGANMTFALSGPAFEKKCVQFGIQPSSDLLIQKQKSDRLKSLQYIIKMLNKNEVNIRKILTIFKKNTFFPEHDPKVVTDIIKLILLNYATQAKIYFSLTESFNDAVNHIFSQLTKKNNDDLSAIKEFKDHLIASGYAHTTDNPMIAQSFNSDMSDNKQLVINTIIREINEKSQNVNWIMAQLRGQRSSVLDLSHPVYNKMMDYIELVINQKITPCSEVLKTAITCVIMDNKKKLNVDEKNIVIENLKKSINKLSSLPNLSPLQKDSIESLSELLPLSDPSLLKKDNLEPFSEFLLGDKLMLFSMGHKPIVNEVKIDATEEEFIRLVGRISIEVEVFSKNFTSAQGTQTINLLRNLQSALADLYSDERAKYKKNNVRHLCLAIEPFSIIKDETLSKNLLETCKNIYPDLKTHFDLANKIDELYSKLVTRKAVKRHN